LAQLTKVFFLSKQSDKTQQPISAFSDKKSSVFAVALCEALAADAVGISDGAFVALIVVLV
jgi:hypothetical protein